MYRKTILWKSQVVVGKGEDGETRLVIYFKFEFVLVLTLKMTT